MTKGEAITIVSACSGEELSDTLLELAVAMKLEENHSPEEILEMVDLVLEGSDDGN